MLLFSCASMRKVPAVEHYPAAIGEPVTLSPDFSVIDNGSLRRNKQGLWELYVEGNPMERGLANGRLTRELLYKQESAFVSIINEFVSSSLRRKMLGRFLRFFNRRLEDHTPEEYKVEIYGVSRASSPDFDFIAPPYHRMLYFHGAHDIGHALQDLALVGCTSFAAWGTGTADGKLLIGRNFDFYAGDAFSEEKIVAFVHPDTGYKHAMVTWAGMIGAVSGMNEKGLTVTINAGKSDIPWKAKTPISLVAREILQYAANISDAVAIAQRREVFVSESIMVGSAADRKAVLIEVSPKKTGVYEVANNTGTLVCTNHFQSEPYQADKNNLRQIAESHSQYRFDRINELLQTNPPLTPWLAADLLRNTTGLAGKPLGYGNEKAINQLLAHHAVIFQPEDRLMWVSSNPYQLGAFVAYDLTEVFDSLGGMDRHTAIGVDSLLIPADPFMHSQAFGNYEIFRKKSRDIVERTAAKVYIGTDELESFIALNPDYWMAYKIAGDYFFRHKAYDKALEYYQEAMTKEVTTLPDKEYVLRQISICKKKMG